MSQELLTIETIRKTVEELFADLEKITGIPYEKLTEKTDAYAEFATQKASLSTDKLIELHAEAIHQKRRFVHKHQYEHAAYLRSLEKMYEYTIQQRISKNNEKNPAFVNNPANQ